VWWGDRAGAPVVAAWCGSLLLLLSSENTQAATHPRLALCSVCMCSRIMGLELALKQTGSESAKRAADLALKIAAEGSNAGIIKVGSSWRGGAGQGTACNHLPLHKEGRHARGEACMQHLPHSSHAGNLRHPHWPLTPLPCWLPSQPSRPHPQAVVREAEGDQYADHPVHLGAEAFVLAELKVTPVVEKKQPGRWAGLGGAVLVLGLSMGWAGRGQFSLPGICRCAAVQVAATHRACQCNSRCTPLHAFTDAPC